MEAVALLSRNVKSSPLGAELPVAQPEIVLGPDATLRGAQPGALLNPLTYESDHRGANT